MARIVLTIDHTRQESALVRFVANTDKIIGLAQTLDGGVLVTLKTQAGVSTAYVLEDFEYVADIMDAY